MESFHLFFVLIAFNTDYLRTAGQLHMDCLGLVTKCLSHASYNPEKGKLNVWLRFIEFEKKNFFFFLNLCCWCESTLFMKPA